MRYIEIFLFMFCAISHQSVMAQTDMYYMSHMKDVLDNSFANRNTIKCIGVDSISNYNTTIPELCNARIFFKGDVGTIDVSGTVCFADISDSGIVLCLRKLPCCDGNIVSYLWCKMAKQQSAKMDTICKMSHTIATTFPRPIDFKPNGVALKLTKDCEIRSSPFLDDDSMYYELRQQGNVVASLRKGAEIYVIASQYQEASLWYFVVVKYNNYVSEAFAERDDRFLFGWLLDTGFNLQKQTEFLE